MHSPVPLFPGYWSSLFLFSGNHSNKVLNEHDYSFVSTLDDDPTPWYIKNSDWKTVDRTCRSQKLTGCGPGKQQQHRDHLSVEIVSCTIGAIRYSTVDIWRTWRCMMMRWKVVLKMSGSMNCIQQNLLVSRYQVAHIGNGWKYNRVKLFYNLSNLYLNQRNSSDVWKWPKSATYSQNMYSGKKFWLKNINYSE